MIPGDMIQLCEEPWHQHAGECVIVLRVDDDGQGFDFVIPESRGHSPMRFAKHTLGHFDLAKLGIKSLPIE
jgi:hypothetical protein